MASTPKKIQKKNNKISDEEKKAIGFLHDVSPVKTSKNDRKYFNATMQTSKGYETVVSFKSEAHISFSCSIFHFRPKNGVNSKKKYQMKKRKQLGFCMMFLLS